MADVTEHQAGGTTSKLREAALWAGPAGIAVAAFGIFGAILLAPWFEFTANALSDLGAAGEPTAPLFNGGLILGGLLAFAFCVRVWPAATNAAHRLGVALLAVGFVNMALVGVFALPDGRHRAVAVAFFLSFTYGLFVHGSGDVLAGHVSRGLTSIWLAVVHLTGWLLFAAAPFDGLAIPELVGSATLAGWVLLTFRAVRGRITRPAPAAR